MTLFRVLSGRNTPTRIRREVFVFEGNSSVCSRNAPEPSGSTLEIDSQDDDVF